MNGKGRKAAPAGRAGAREVKEGPARGRANWTSHPATEPAVAALRRFLAEAAPGYPAVQAAKAQIRVLAELGAPEALPAIEAAAGRPELRGTAVWALQKVKAALPPAEDAAPAAKARAGGPRPAGATRATAARP